MPALSDKQMNKQNELATALLENTRAFIYHYDIKLEINPSAIDEACANHSVLFAEAGIRVSDAKESLERTKLLVKEVRSALDADIRNNPDEYGLEKLTEAALNSVIERDKSIIGLEKARIKIELSVNLLSNFLSAFEHRRSMLNNIVTLIQTGTYQYSRESGEGIRNSYRDAIAKKANIEDRPTSKGAVQKKIRKVIKKGRSN